MNTDTTPTVHVHRPSSCDSRETLRCPRCKQNRRCVASWFVWYDPIVRCCACGAAWGGIRYSTPTGRNAAPAIKRARELWANAGTTAQAKLWLREQIETGVDPTELRLYDISNTAGSTCTYAARSELAALDNAATDGLIRNRTKAKVTDRGQVPFPADRGGRVYQHPKDRSWVLTDFRSRTFTYPAVAA